jgi:hypothetical protein
VRRAIVGFHQDDDAHWVAELACGHRQHVRHDPPWQRRPWVVTPEGRAAFLGAELECVLCEAGAKDPDPPSRTGSPGGPGTRRITER